MQGGLGWRYPPSASAGGLSPPPAPGTEWLPFNSLPSSLWCPLHVEWEATWFDVQ